MHDELMEAYGIFEDENGQLFIESEVVEYVMDEYDLYEEDAIEVIMEAYEDELYNEGKVSKAIFGDYGAARNNLATAREKQIAAGRIYASEIDNKNQGKDTYEVAKRNVAAANADRIKAEKDMAKATLRAAAPGAALAAGVAARKAYKKHKAKKEAEAKRNRGLKGKLRRLREDYGIIENEYGELFIENEMIEAVMDEFNLYEEDAIEVIMEAYEEELYSEERVRPTTKEDSQKVSRLYAGMNSKNGSDHSVRNRRAAGGALAVGAAAGGAYLAHKAYKNHKAKKEAEQKKGKKRRLREDYGIFEDENGQLFIENEMVEYVMDEYDLYEEDAIEAIMEAYEEELFSEERVRPTNKEDSQKVSRLYAGMNPKNGSDHSVRNRRVGGALAAGAVVGSAALARKAYKKHKAKKEAEQKKGKKRRLCETYGVYEENGQIFVDPIEVQNVMESYNLSQEDAIDLIVESYAEEVYYLENAAQEVVAASHQQVSVEADKQLRQAEMDEGDADRNLARGGKHILGGIRRAPRSEQDQAGEAGVHFKNRVDDGDMDGEFIDSNIQKPMGAGRRIAENSDMGF